MLKGKCVFPRKLFPFLFQPQGRSKFEQSSLHVLGPSLRTAYLETKHRHEEEPNGGEIVRAWESVEGELERWATEYQLIVRSPERG
jgi:hypothetical protein